VACFTRPHDVPLHASAFGKYENRRLPGITQRDTFIWRFYSTRENECRAPLQNCRALGGFPGAACCHTFWPEQTLDQVSRGRLSRTKAAPLQGFFALFAPLGRRS
jgi:hypothetical protein